MKILDVLSAEVGVLLVSGLVESMDIIVLNCWIKRRENVTTTVAGHCGFMTQENVDTIPCLIRRDSWYGQTGATCCEREALTA